LDGIYTAFGQVVAGQDVVERIEQGDRLTRVTVAESP
jgi:cyclophilin family peptidyl-prolyl cis-trans isomerase